MYIKWWYRVRVKKKKDTKMKQNEILSRYIFDLICDALEDSLHATYGQREECSICLSELDHNDRLKLQNCNHQYHPACLRMYAVSEMCSYARKCNKTKRVVSYPIKCPLCKHVSRVDIDKKLDECEKMINCYKNGDIYKRKAICKTKRIATKRKVRMNSRKNNLKL